MVAWKQNSESQCSQTSTRVISKETKHCSRISALAVSLFIYFSCCFCFGHFYFTMIMNFLFLLMKWFLYRLETSISIYNFFIWCSIMLDITMSILNYYNDNLYLLHYEVFIQQSSQGIISILVYTSEFYCVFYPYGKIFALVHCFSPTFVYINEEQNSSF